MKVVINATKGFQDWFKVVTNVSCEGDKIIIEVDESKDPEMLEAIEYSACSIRMMDGKTMKTKNYVRSQRAINYLKELTPIQLYDLLKENNLIEVSKDGKIAREVFERLKDKNNLSSDQELMKWFIGE